jgi:hypothetical protein
MGYIGFNRRKSTSLGEMGCGHFAYDAIGFYCLLGSNSVTVEKLGKISACRSGEVG